MGQTHCRVDARPESGLSRRKTWALLGLILIAGLGLRAWYGSWGLHRSRFWDEQYAIKNVRAVLLTGDVKPVNVYYPSPVWSVPLAAVLKVSDVLYSRTGNDAYRVLNDRRRLTPTARLLCRWMQAIYGTLATLFVFLAGRRMFGAHIALLAAAMVAFAPWPIHSSGIIKPDALLLMAITMSFWASLAAVDKPTVSRHLWVGVAIALAMSSKLTGGLIAVPLVVAVLMLGRRERRRVALLAVAGVSSAVLFVALNPYWKGYLFFLEGLKRDYAMRAGLAEMTRLSIPFKVIRYITDDYLHGLIVGLASLIGFALLALSVVRHGQVGSEVDRAKRAMFVIFPLIYTLAYAIQTPYFKPNNFQPLVLFTALSAAWLLVGGWRLAAARWRLLQRLVVSLGMIMVLAFWLVIPGWIYTYRTLTPTTRALAVYYLEKYLGQPRSARLIHAEVWEEPKPPWGGSRGSLHRGLSAIKGAPSLESFSAAELDSSDGLIFFAHRLDDEAAAFYDQRKVGGPAPQVKVFRAEPFKSRGPSLVAIVHRWRLREPYRDLEARPCRAAADGCLTLDLPADLSPGEIASFFAKLPFADRPRDDQASAEAGVPWITVGDRTLKLSVASKQRDGWLYVSPRFRVADELRQARLTREVPFGKGRPLIQVVRWSANTTSE